MGSINRQDSTRTRPRRLARPSAASWRVRPRPVPAEPGNGSPNCSPRMSLIKPVEPWQSSDRQRPATVLSGVRSVMISRSNLFACRHDVLGLSSFLGLDPSFLTPGLPASYACARAFGRLTRVGPAGLGYLVDHGIGDSEPLGGRSSTGEHY